MICNQCKKYVYGLNVIMYPERIVAVREAIETYEGNACNEDIEGYEDIEGNRGV